MSAPSSQLSDTLNNTRLERALRDAVTHIYDSGDHEELTVKRVRAAVERELSLDDGFFKQTEWKSRSKSIIEDEALKRGNVDAESNTKSSSQAQAKSKSSERTANSSTTKDKVTGRKRKVVNNVKDKDEQGGGQSAKKQRKSRPVVSDDEDGEEEHITPRPSRSTANESDDLEGLHSNQIQPKSDTELSDSRATTNNTAIPNNVNDLHDSDLSEVLDEAPVPKRKKKSHTKKPESNGRKQTKAAKPKTMDAEAEEIKSLQGWLVKCGIRKVWGKELKPYETSKEKIKHLKQMLTDAGMSGRYSKEKAASIREARELAADLEAVQEGAKLWGKEKDVDTSGGRRSARTTMPVLDFGDSGSED